MSNSLHKPTEEDRQVLEEHAEQFTDMVQLSIGKDIGGRVTNAKLPYKRQIWKLSAANGTDT